MTTIHERVPFLGFAIVALLLPTIGTSRTHPHLYLTDLAGTGRRIHCQLLDQHDLQDHPARNTRHIFRHTGGARKSVHQRMRPSEQDIFWITSIRPSNFAVCFFIASIFFTISWFALAQTREPEDNEKVIPEEKTHFWHDCKKDPEAEIQISTGFSSRVSSRNLQPWDFRSTSFMPCAASTWMPSQQAFSPPHSPSRRPLQISAWAGSETALVIAAMLIIGAFAALLSSVLAWNATSIAWFYPIFILTGFANVSIWTNGMAMTVDFGSESGTSDLHWPFANAHRPRHHHRPAHRRLDRGYSRLHPNIYHLHHPIHCDDRHSCISGKRSTQTCNESHQFTTTRSNPCPSFRKK